MFAKLKAWIFTFLGAAIAIGTIFKFGERSGKRKAKHAETKRRLQSTQDMKEIEHEVTSQDEDHLTNTLNRFMRKQHR